MDEGDNQMTKGIVGIFRLIIQSLTEGATTGAVATVFSKGLNAIWGGMEGER